MIIELFLSLLALALVAIGLGYFTGDEHYAFVGLFFLFLLGVYIFTNQLEYQSGAVVSTNYSYMNGSVTTSATSVTYNLSPYNDSYTRWFGVLLSVSAGAGMAFSLMNWRQRKREDDA